MAVTDNPIVALAGFLGIIIVLLVLIGRYRWHVFVALLLPILLFGVLPQVDQEAFIAAFEEGFGNTLSSIGVVIVLGSIIAEAMKHTGAIERITLSMVNLIGRAKMPLALTFTGYVLGVAIFGDVAYVIVNPLVHSAAIEYGVSMGLMASGLVGAMQLTHAVVPPTPGPLAAAAVLGADLGMVIIYGAVVSFVGAIGCWAWANWVGARIDSPPSEEFTGQSLADEGREDELPGVAASYMPIMVPIVLIAGHSACALLWSEGNGVTRVLAYLGWPVVALSIGLLLAVRLAKKRQRSEAVSSWVEEALTTSAIIFAVTGLGGSLSYIIQETPTVEFVAESVVQAGIPTIVIPFLIGVLVNMITGSSTVGVIAAASLVAPMLKPLGLSPEAAMLAGASGSIVIKYVNSSYFWVCTSLSEMKVDKAIIAYGGSTLVGGVLSFLATCALWVAGLI